MCTARKLQDIKLKAATDVEGSLNYSKRLVSLRERFNQDFISAYSRLRAAKKGFEIVFNRKDDETGELPSNFSDPNIFDKCLLWARKNVEYLIKIGGIQQGAIIPFSLKKELKQSFESTKNSGFLKLSLNSSHFKNMGLIRLRGVSCFIFTKNGDTNQFNKNNLWQLQVIPPRSADFIYQDGTTKRHSQNSIKPIYIGRVSSRSSQLPSEVVGVKALLNSSPIGDWTVEVLGNLNNISFEEIEDIQIDIHCSFVNI